uniref:Uncharacterized protein n=1 Tax=virus sp. ctML55 TaxID=2827627 RepID=A0A8S5RHA3_9VIRU|nr:MAG TPA: hypothetical protein [virus sp. ctML55]DAV51718.1 MAG TPA: hypothetical protein [Bacteriophage sp.]
MEAIPILYLWKQMKGLHYLLLLAKSRLCQILNGLINH